MTGWRRKSAAEQTVHAARPYLELVECQTGDILIRQGDVGDCLYLLFAGRVTVAPPDPGGHGLALAEHGGTHDCGRNGPVPNPAARRFGAR